MKGQGVARAIKLKQAICRPRFLLLGIVLICSVVPAAAENSPPISIEANVIALSTTEATKKLYLTIGNNSTRPINILAVSFETSSGDHPIQVPQILNASQWETISLLLSQDTSKKFILKLRYKDGDVESAITKLITINEDGGWLSGDYLKTITPALLGIIGVLVGATLTAYYNHRKEKFQRGYEWSKMLFETYQAQYRLFNQRVSGTLNHQQISTYFEDLERNALVPTQLKRRLGETLEKMKSETDIQKQREIRDGFLEKFIKLVADPLTKKKS